MKSRILFVLVPLVLIIALLASCAPAAPQATEAPKETTLERAKREGVIRLGFANEVPFGYADPSGKLAGESPDVAKAVFSKMGIASVEGVLTEFGGLIPGLQAGRYDAITAGMYVKPKRCEEVLFSNPDYCIGQALAVKAGNPLNLHSYEDIAANPDAKVGVMAGAFEEDYLLKVGVPKERIVIFPDGPSGISGLQADRVDAFTLTSLSVQSLLQNANDPGLERATPFADPVIDGAVMRGCGAVAFRKEDAALRDAFNAELAKMIASGELLTILAPYGFTEAELPGDMTAEKLCSAPE